MMRRLGVLAFCVGACAAIALPLPNLTLLALGILGLGVWYATARKGAAQ